MGLLNKSNEKKILLTKEDLLKKPELKIQEVDLGDVVVFVREMTGFEREQFENSIYEVKMQGDKASTITKFEFYKAKLAVCTICDKDGDLILSPGDAEALSKNMKASHLETIAKTAQDINKISKEEKEDLLKNSEAAQSGSSSSD